MVEIKENNDLEDRYIEIYLDIVALLTDKPKKSTISIRKIRERLEIHRNQLVVKNPYRETA